MPNSKKENWVDYKEIKERITMEMVLARYGVFEKLRPSGQNLVGVCPIHKGSNPRQFSVNPERNIFNCFGNCKSGGNVIDFVAKMEKVNLHEAALLLKNWFLPELPDTSRPPATLQKERPELVRKENKEKSSETPGKPTGSLVNPPLTFELKNLAADHAFFQDRGIAPETVQHFGLGFCLKGMMANRIVIPIYNEAGELVAYCGRAVSESQIEEEGKYKLPPNFVKLHVVYNLNRQARSEKLLILVESFLSVFKLHQAGLRNAVALMGSILGEHQEQLLINFLGPDGWLILAFDADEDGRKCTDDCLHRLGRHLFVRAVDVSEHGRKPHQLTEETLNQIFSF
jgi:DNA primase